MTKTEYEKKIAELEAQIEEIKNTKIEENPLKPPHPRWKPERDEHYYTIDIGGACAGWETWDSDNLDGDIYFLGFVFKTEAEAEFAIERLKVLAEMREWAGNWDDGVALKYDGTNKRISTTFITFISPRQYTFGEMRFATEEDAEGCIKAVGEDRLKKYYFLIPETK